MDTLTQVTLGASIGELVLGSKLGKRAPLWGAALGTLPDLDVFAAAFLTESAQLGVHRGLSHSFLGAICGGLGLGYALSILHSDATWREWSLLSFLALLTHALLDSFTMYGTQLFKPFSNYPVALGSIFIIDPLYTLPLGGGLIAALFQRRLHWRRRLNAIGLCLSSAYLLLSAASYLHVRTAFTQALSDQGIAHQRLFVTPTPFNTVLWAGLAAKDDHLWTGLYSLFDEEPAIRFRRIERNTSLIADKITEEPVQRLLWFSRGYYQAERKDGKIFFSDLRFGRSDSWIDTTGSYIFVFRLVADPEDPSRVADFRQLDPFADADLPDLTRFWRRLKGNPDIENH